MFCHNTIRFDHFTECPFYYAYAKLVSGMQDQDLESCAGPFSVLKKEADDCRRRCDRKRGDV